MAKIIDITPKSLELRPVLILETSRRMDCFLLCVKCLELYTDLERFKTIYVLADDVGDEHSVIIKAFQKRHKNVIDVHVLSKSATPGTAGMLNFILRRHSEDVVIKMDENVFVTPRWLENLLGTYKIHKQHPDVAAVSCLIPISRIGRQCLDRVFRRYYPEERLRIPDMPVEKNAVYHRFMWDKILFDSLVDKYFELDKPKHHYSGTISSRCLLFDSRLIDPLLPLPTHSLEGTGFSDSVINNALKESNLKACVVAETVVHHFSYFEVEDYVQRHISLDDVWWFMTCLDESPAYLKSKARGIVSLGQFNRTDPPLKPQL